MLLKQLLERNERYLHEALMVEKNHRKYVGQHSKQSKKQKQFGFLQKNLHISSSNLLESHGKKPTLKRNQTLKQSKGQSQFGINGQKFIFHNQKIQRKSSSLCQQIKVNQKIGINQERNSFLLKNNVQGHKTAQSFYKNQSSKSIKNRNALTATKNNRNGQIMERILKLPDSFMIKSSLNTLSRPHSTFIKYEEKQEQSGQGIHSRKNMQKNNQKFRKNSKARSKSVQSMSRQNKLYLDHSFKMQESRPNIQTSKTLKLQSEFPIGVQKVKFIDKPKKKDSYVNVFYEYRKAKVKIEKEQFYSPWKKNAHGRRDINLSELYQLHD